MKKKGKVLNRDTALQKVASRRRKGGGSGRHQKTWKLQREQEKRISRNDGEGEVLDDERNPKWSQKHSSERGILFSLCATHLLVGLCPNAIQSSNPRNATHRKRCGAENGNG